MHDQGKVSEDEFERGLSNLFRSARHAQVSLGTEYTRVHLDWSEDPMKIGLAGSGSADR